MVENDDQNKDTNKNKRFRKDKPWDNNPDLDKWKLEEFKEGDMKSSLLEKSTFAVLFPQYREKYIDEVFPLIKKCLHEYGIRTELDKLEGSITISTSSKTWDPFIILKARDFVKLLSRSVPFEKAKLVLQDGIDNDIIKIRHFVKNKERFIKRRQRLIGPKGMTLKALELLTECYILVQGSTVSVIGKFKNLKLVRRIVLDCMQNIHPVYHIKELMIKEELSKDPEMKDQNWDRFLPQFKKRCVKRKKVKKVEKEYNPFPPEQLPRKVDLEMESGEYWEKKDKKEKNDKNKNDNYKQNNNKNEKLNTDMAKKNLSSKKDEEDDFEDAIGIKKIKNNQNISEKKKEKLIEKEKKYIAPKEILNNREDKITNKSPSLEELKNKFMLKKEEKINKSK